MTQAAMLICELRQQGSMGARHCRQPLSVPRLPSGVPLQAQAEYDAIWHPNGRPEDPRRRTELGDDLRLYPTDIPTHWLYDHDRRFDDAKIS